MAGGRHISPSHQFAWVLKREPPDREFRNRRSDLHKKEANICNISSGREELEELIYGHLLPSR
jgi:hypothetical protein